ncbi:MAG: hypothetical protein N4A68_12405 [Maledivibacter sp.]|jgi:hypothetical protein|nr:hypothetical protein [Maledivibacter sp.]
MKDLIIGCNKFIEQKYTVEEFSRFLSRVAIPSEIVGFVREAENRIEYIRFMVSSAQRYDECVKVINELLEKIS